MIRVRWGLMIVGLPYSGKSTSYEILAGALIYLAQEKKVPGYEKVEIHKINPKSITKT